MSPRMTDHHRSPSAATMTFLGRSVLSLRRNQVVSMENYHEEELQDLDLFQSYVADRLLSLLVSPQAQTEKPPSTADRGDHTTSFSFLQRLLDVFVSCEAEFKNLLARNLGPFAKPPVDRLLADLLVRSVKSLDICKAVGQNLQSLRHWNRNADIAASAIPTHAESPVLLSEGHLRRTKKALASLLAFSEASNPILQEPAAGRKPERAWSFRCKAASAREESSLLQHSYSKSWSGPKQVQAMSAGLAAPRAGDAGSGFAVAVYTMSSVLEFAMWALIAAFPCQERSAGAVPAVAPPKQLAWSAAMCSLQERIAEELRRRGRREGVLAEFLRVEKCGKELMELAAAGGGGGVEAVVAKARELAKASGRLGEGLGPFERQVREVFRRVADSRGEVMKFLEQSTTSAPPPFLVL